MADQEILKGKRHAARQFHTHDRAETALLDIVAHGSQQIVGLVFLNLTVGVARDAEHAVVLHLIAREQHPHAIGDQIFHHKDVAVTRSKVNRLFARQILGHKEETRHVVRILETREVGFLVARVGAAQLNHEIDAAARNHREGASAIHTLWSQNGQDFGFKILVDHLTAHTGEFVIGDEVHVLLFKRGLELFEPQLLGFVEQLTHTASNLDKLLGGRHLVGARRQHVAARLTLQVHDAHHVKLIEVVKEDREELDTVKQRHFSVFSRFQNLTVKFDPADFTVGVERWAVKVDRHRRFFFLGNLGRFFSRGGRLFYYRLTAALDRICLRGCRRRFLLLVRSRNLRLHRLLLNFFCVAFSHFFLHHG